MACVSKIGSLYELVTKNVVVTTTNTVFGINPRIWLSLPCEGLLLAVVNSINVAVTGAAMVNNTERLVYFNKVRGVLRLMDCCVPTTAASASETTVDEE